MDYVKCTCNLIAYFIPIITINHAILCKMFMKLKISQVGNRAVFSSVL